MPGITTLGKLFFYFFWQPPANRCGLDTAKNQPRQLRVRNATARNSLLAGKDPHPIGMQCP
jgi:hypothetical protein